MNFIKEQIQKGFNPLKKGNFKSIEDRIEYFEKKKHDKQIDLFNNVKNQNELFEGSKDNV